MGGQKCARKELSVYGHGAALSPSRRSCILDLAYTRPGGLSGRAALAGV